MNFTGVEDWPVFKQASTGSTVTTDRYPRWIDEIFAALPEKEVDINETWNNEKKYGNLLFKNTYRILEETVREGIECLKIEVKSNIIHKTGSMDTREENRINILYFDHNNGMFLFYTENFNQAGFNIRGGNKTPVKFNRKRSFTVKYD